MNQNTPLNKEETKKCSKCGILKPIAEFSKRSEPRYKDSYKSACKRCAVISNKTWKTANPAKVKQYVKQWRKQNAEVYKKLYLKYRTSNPLRYRASKIIQTARSNAKRKKVPFRLTPQYVFEKMKSGHCEVTGMKFVISKDARNPYSPSIDKIKPSLGYTEGNVRIILWALNAFKSNFSDAEIYPIAKAFCESFEKEMEIPLL